MDLKATQRFLAELYTDEAQRQRFAARPQAVAEEFGIAPDAARQLAELSAAQVAGFARCLQRKRLNEVRRMLPETCRALGSDLAQVFEAHAARFQPQGVRRHLDDALAFARFLSQSPGVNTDLVDLARYEAHWLRFRQGRVGPLLAIFRSDPRETATGCCAESGHNRGLLACWFRLGGRLRHVAIRLPCVWVR